MNRNSTKKELFDGIDTECRELNRFHEKAGSGWRMPLIMEEIEKNLISVSLNQLAKQFGLTPAYLSFIIKKNVGRTFSQIRRDLRMKRGKNLLKEYPDLLVKQVSFAVGYKDQGHFSKMFKNNSSFCPSLYREEMCKSNIHHPDRIFAQKSDDEGPVPLGEGRLSPKKVKNPRKEKGRGGRVKRDLF